MLESEEREKITKILEACFKSPRTEELIHPFTCDMCGKKVTRYIAVDGHFVGLTCDCQDIVFRLLVAFNEVKVKRIAKKLGIMMEVLDIPIKVIEVKSNE